MTDSTGYGGPPKPEEPLDVSSSEIQPGIKVSGLSNRYSHPIIINGRTVGTLHLYPCEYTWLRDRITKKAEKKSRRSTPSRTTPQPEQPTSSTSSSEDTT